MKWPFVSRREHDAVLADRERIRGERNQFAADRDTYREAARTASRLADAGPADIDAWERALAAHLAWTPGLDTEPGAEGVLPRPPHPATILHRALAHCRALEARLAAAEGRPGEAL